MTNIRVDIQRASSDTGIPANQQLEAWAGMAVQNPGGNVELTIRIVDEEEAAALNEQWRKKSGPTNILSFPFDGDRELANGLLGDIVICAPVVRQEAHEQNKALTAHWAHMVIHGVLHLQGYDHIKNRDVEVMESLEITLLQSLGYDNPYLEQLNT